SPVTCGPRHGKVVLLVAVCLSVLLSVVAIASDGGVLLQERRHAQATADAEAARAACAAAGPHGGGRGAPGPAPGPRRDRPAGPLPHSQVAGRGGYGRSPPRRGHPHPPGGRRVETAAQAARGALPDCCGSRGGTRAPGGCPCGCGVKLAPTAL